MEIREVVFIGEKAGLAVMAALHDVQWYFVEMGSRATGHDLVTSVATCHWKIFRAWPL